MQATRPREMAGSLDEPELATQIPLNPISSAFELLSIKDCSSGNWRSSVSQCGGHNSSDASTNSKPPHPRGAKGRIQTLMERWLLAPEGVDPWSHLRILSYPDGPGYTWAKASERFPDCPSLDTSVVGEPRTSVVGGYYTPPIGVSYHTDEETSIISETPRFTLGATRPSGSLSISKSHVTFYRNKGSPKGGLNDGKPKSQEGSQPPTEPKPRDGLHLSITGGRSRKSRLPHLTLSPSTRPKPERPVEGKVGLDTAVIPADIPRWVPNHNIQPVETSSLGVDNRGKQENWFYPSETGSSETESESTSKTCSVGDDDDIFRALPNKLLAQIFSDEDSSGSGIRTAASGMGARYPDKGKGRSAPAESGESSSPAYGYSKSLKSNGRKRKCLNFDDGDEEEDEDNSRGFKKEKPQTRWPPRLCPEFVANPSHPDFARGGKRFNSCTLKDISKMPQHIKRYHTMPEQCDNCGFRGDAGQVKDHKETPCESKPFDPVPLADKEKADRLKQKRGSPWCEVFKIQTGSDVANSPKAKNYIACLEASPDFSRSFAEYLQPRWELMVKEYYESTQYQTFSEKHPDVNFGPSDPSRSKSEIENLFVEGFLYPGRPPRAFETPTDNYPTPFSTSSFGNGGITPSPQSTPSSFQTDDSSQTTPPPIAPLHTANAQTSRPTPQNPPRVSLSESPQTYGTSGNSKPPLVPAAHHTSTASRMPFENRPFSVFNLPGTTEQNDSGKPSPEYPVKCNSQVLSQQPAQSSVPLSDVPAATFYSPPVPFGTFANNGFRSVIGAENRRPIVNVDRSQNSGPLPSAGIGDAWPVYYQGLNQPEQPAGFGPMITAIDPSLSLALKKVPSTFVAHEALAQGNGNQGNSHGHTIKDQARPLLSSRQQQTFQPSNCRSSLLPQATGPYCNIPPDSRLQYLVAPQPVTYEPSGLSCVSCILDASADGGSMDFNGRTGQPHTYQSDNVDFQVEIPSRPTRLHVSKNLYSPPPTYNPPGPPLDNGTQLPRPKEPEDNVTIQRNVWKYPQGNFVIGMASSDSVEAHSSVTGIESCSQSVNPIQNAGLSPGLSCNAESGIEYLYNNSRASSQAQGVQAQVGVQTLPSEDIWEDWFDAADIA